MLDLYKKNTLSIKAAAKPPSGVWGQAVQVSPLGRFRGAVFFLFLSLSVFSQKEDSKWIMGMYYIDFRDNYKATSTESAIKYWNTRPSISSKTGNLLFSSNGYTVFSTNNQNMLGGDTLFNNYMLKGDYSGGAPFLQGAIIIPFVNNSGNYYLFYETDNEALNIPRYWQPTALYYAVINMDSAKNQGKVLSKNNLLLQDTLSDSRMAACRHANGKDWWLIKPEYLSNKYFKFLIDEAGVHGPIEQEIGGTFRESDASGWASFSPDGSLFASATGRSNIWIFDFDRCTGNFSNARSVTMPYDSLGFDGDGANGVNFSEDNHYLYANSLSSLYQFELDKKSRMPVRETLVATGGIANPPYYEIYTASFTPDGKIYTGNNGHQDYTIINKPNEEGSNCDVSIGLFGLSKDTFFGTFAMSYIPIFTLGKSPVYADSIDIGVDTTICTGEYVTLGGVTTHRNLQYEWSSVSGNYHAVGRYVTVSPLETTTYYVRITDKYIDSSCALKYDTVTVTVKEQCPSVRFPSFIDKAKQPLFVVHPLTVGSSLTLYNSIGQKIYQQANYNNDFSTQNLPNGVYIYNYLNGGDGKQFRGKVEVME